MIKGMTGFGSTKISAGKIRGLIEVKSLNHRYFDINFFLPAGFGSVEEKIRQLVQRKIQRGRVTVALKITEKIPQLVHFNKDTIRQYLKYAQRLKKEFDLTGSLSLPELISLPGVLETKESMPGPENLWPAVNKGLNSALAGLEHMRKREGKSLALDIKDKLGRMRAEIKKIRARAARLLSEKKKKLTEEEFVSFQKSCDVNEEIARLTHYIDEFQLLLKSSASVGKKLDFIAQEMQRETNTIGAKLQDKVVSNAVIALKSKIEKIREQSQNIE